MESEKHTRLWLASDNNKEKLADAVSVGDAPSNEKCLDIGNEAWPAHPLGRRASPSVFLCWPVVLVESHETQFHCGFPMGMLPSGQG